MNITWKELVKVLEGRGWLVTQLASQIGKSPAVICDIKAERTKEPKGMAAVILYQLYTTNMPPPTRAAK
ncbi:XRE family transcriptional regulator [Stenotrophomonas maltophilia]|uniref:XRE family transcriptional regulator n=1 Tax=Stenotrophomonas maltophilia TaxID=40324 RepID=UPI001FA705B2|nr:XRE family transcriptional regulator [Stenotrophomonas maltophilia]